MKKSPYDIIKKRYITEKTEALLSLHTSEHNPCVRRCKTPKYVFIVDKNANKIEIAAALEEIYAESNFRVLAVNIINTKRKPVTIRGRKGFKPSFKKAIVTLAPGGEIPEKV